jgi:hypothetical protein
LFHQSTICDIKQSIEWLSRLVSQSGEHSAAQPGDFDEVWGLWEMIYKGTESVVNNSSP